MRMPSLLDGFDLDFVLALGTLMEVAAFQLLVIHVSIAAFRTLLQHDRIPGDKITVWIVGAAEKGFAAL